MHILKWVMVLLVAIVTMSHVEAQEGGLFGKVRDNNNNPLAHATVKVVGQNKAAMTDENGDYRIEQLKPGNYTIETTAIGFNKQDKEVRITGTGQHRLDFILKEGQRAIEQVNVAGKSQAKKLQETGFNVNVIETKQYANSNTDINQILNRSTGVKIREQGGLGSNFSFSINGMSGNHIKFFIDGVPIEAYGSGMSFNNIPVNIVERIAVYK